VKCVRWPGGVAAVLNLGLFCGRLPDTFIFCAIFQVNFSHILHRLLQFFYLFGNFSRFVVNFSRYSGNISRFLAIFHDFLAIFQVESFCNILNLPLYWNPGFNTALQTGCEANVVATKFIVFFSSFFFLSTPYYFSHRRVCPRMNRHLGSLRIRMAQNQNRVLNDE
jgi:hypothetical protein